MCIFYLYPIPDSQQCVKRGSCRRLILSGLLCFFLFLGRGPICDEFRSWALNLVIFFVYFIESLSYFVLVFYFVFYFVSNYCLSLISFVSFRIVSCLLYLFTSNVILFVLLCFVINRIACFVYV